MNHETIKLDLEHATKQRADVLADIASYEKTLKLADVATLLMLFVFLVGFYVSDPFHIASFIAEKIQNEAIELLVYGLLLTMALLMALAIARLKRAHYVHKAKYRFSGSVWKVAAVIMAFTVFAEMYNATGNQQHSQYAKAENSKAFEAIAGQKVEINAGGNYSLQLPKLQGDLAEAESYLAGCKKTCSQWRAKVDKLRAQIEAIEANQKQAAITAENAATGAANALATNLQKLKDDYLHPMVKALMSLGLPASVAMQLIAALVAIAFERMHLSASENLRDCYARLDELDSQLLGKRKELAVMDEFSARPAKHPIGFNRPDPTPTPAIAKRQIGFIWEDEPKPVKAKMQSKPTTPSTPAAQKTEPVKADFSHFKATGGGWASPALSDAETPSKPALKPLAGAFTETPSKPLAGGHEGLYGAWVEAVIKGECKPSVDPTWSWIQKRISNKETGSRTHDRTRISNMQRAFFARAMKEGYMLENPNYRNGGKKYLWIA